jgi:thiamine-monophosphate kinase
VNEFELIDRFFVRGAAPAGFVHQGIGDDCALLDCGERLLAVTTDLLVEGRHFLPGTDAECLGHKALAVNLSDLAAAGASPRAFQLALALPRADEAWLAAFARGMFALADEHECALIGGDTTRAPQLAAGAAAAIDGPLTICITALGDLPRQFVRTRAGARVGDDLWVSGTLGDAAAALAWRQNQLPGLRSPDVADCLQRMDRPQPRVALGVALRGIATSAIDLSDGLVGDLAHIRKRSRVGAIVEVDQLPHSDALRALPAQTRQRLMLAGGDDYELLFTAVPERREAVERAGAATALRVSRIGRIVDGDRLTVLDAQGRSMPLHWQAFDHFAA